MKWFARLAHVTTLALLAVFTVRVWRNLKFLRHARNIACLPPVLPLVSVLVPARNEARTIAACIESLACQTYPNFEVIVMDDQSSDETGALIDALASAFACVTALHGTENPPAGWNGKSFACQRLAEQATGEWLLFTDADTLHSPSSLAQGIAQAHGLNVDLLSAFPKQVTESWGERVMVSFILDFLPMIGLDLAAVWRGDAKRTAANGQYLLMRSAAYHAIGGHRADFSALVDDFALARRAQNNGYKTALIDGTAMVRCRMYCNAREVWMGFSKNLLLALNSSATKRFVWWQSALFAWGYACVFVIPFNFLRSDQRKLALLEIGWLVLLRGMVNAQFGRPLAEIVTTPLAAWSVMALGLTALARRRRGKPIQWKGREYKL